MPDTGQAAGMRYMGGDYYGDPGSQRTYDTRTKTYSTNYNWLADQLRASGQYVGDEQNLTSQQQAAKQEAQRRLGAEDFAREQTIRRGRFTARPQEPGAPVGIEALKQESSNRQPGIEAAKQREIDLARSRASTTREEAGVIANMLRSPTSSITQRGIERGYELVSRHDERFRPEHIATKYTTYAEFNRAYPSFAPKAYYPEQTIKDIGQTVRVQHSAMYANLGNQSLPKTYGNRYDIYSNASIEAGRERVFAGQEAERYRESQRQKADYAKKYWEKLSPAEKLTSGVDVVASGLFTGSAKSILSGKQKLFSPEQVYEEHIKSVRESQKHGYAGGFASKVTRNEAAIVAASATAAGAGLGIMARVSPYAAKITGLGLAGYASYDIGKAAYQGRKEEALSGGLAFVAATPFVKTGFYAGKETKLPTYRQMFGYSKQVRVSALKESLISETAIKPPKIVYEQAPKSSTYRKMFGYSKEQRVKQLRSQLISETEIKPNVPSVLSESIVPKGYGKSSFGDKGMIPKPETGDRVILIGKQAQRARQVSYETKYTNEYKPNMADYVEDIKADLARLEGKPTKPGSKTLKSLGQWDFAKNKFIRTPEAEARASRSTSASSIFDRMEKRTQLKEKLKEVESVEYNMPTVQEPTNSPMKVKMTSSVIDLSGSGKAKAPYFAKRLTGKTIKKIGLVQRTQTIQIQRERQVLAQRPKFGLYEGYQKRLQELSPTKTTTGIRSRGLYVPMSQQKQASVSIAEQKHINILKGAQGSLSSSIQGLRQIQGIGQGQMIRQDMQQKQTQSQIQRQIQKQIQKQTQRQVLREPVRMETPGRKYKPPEPHIKSPSKLSGAFKKQSVMGKSKFGKFTTSLRGKTVQQIEAELRGKKTTRKAGKRKTTKRTSKRKSRK